MTNHDDLIARLLKVESSTQNMSNSFTTNWYRNPDGPEAVRAIESLQSQLAEAREFALLSSNRDHAITCESLIDQFSGNPNKWRKCSCGFADLLAKHKEQP